jgi:sensor histidine kinase YesM
MTEAPPGLYVRFATIVYGLMVSVVLSLLIGQVLSAKYNVIYYYSEPHDVTNFSVTVDGEERDGIVAPTTLTGLAPGATVTLATTLNYRVLDNLMFKNLGAPMTVFANGRPVYSYGDLNTYPPFQKQPPPAIASIALPEAAVLQTLDPSLDGTERLNLVLEYTLLDTQDTLGIPEFRAGDKTLLFQELLSANLLGLLLGFVMLFGSLVLAAIGLAVMRHAEMATAFVWLGLTCLACAVWTLGSNDVVLFLVPQSSLLYTLSEVGFFIGIVPLLRFGMTFLQPRYLWPLLSLQTITAALFIVIVVTHLSGAFSFAQWMPYVQIVEFVALLLFVADVVVEMVVFRSTHARLLLIVLIVFAVLVTGELSNQYLGALRSSGELIQLGLALLIAVFAFIAWRQVTKAFEAAERSEQLELEIASINRNLEVQRTLFETLATTSEEIRKLRHDMRHQLSAIKGMIESEKIAEAENYIDTLYGNIPSIANRILCDNFAVNALAVHFLTIAESHEIQCDLRLVVPRKVGRILDNDLCVIIGNLLENAIEACAHVEKHKRFIKMSTTVDKVRFTLVMDNSFDGQLKVWRDAFYSRKRGMRTRGIGMQSVRAEVLKYDGAMKYETENEIFKTSLYIKT